MPSPYKKRRLNILDDTQNTQNFSHKEEETEHGERANENQAEVHQAEVDHEEDVSPSSPSAMAADEDKQQWQGFCEIESDPAFFNVILRELGVRGIRVQEVLGLDETILETMPKPVHGLIFLFRYKKDDAGQQEEACPDYVWFANQISDNSCATVALLNVVNNIPDAELGEILQSFKDFSKNFTPYLRGDAITNFEFVRRIHNSFARKSDMRNIDQAMKEKFMASKRKTKAAGAKTRKKARAHADEEDSAFHFIAYMPINGEVWKLDGLDRQPQKIGDFMESDWIDVVAPLLTARMIGCAKDQTEFSLMSLVRDPIVGYREDLSDNIKALQTLGARLDSIEPDWKSFVTDSTHGVNGSDLHPLVGPSERFGITAEAIQKAVIPPSIEKRMAIDDDATTLIDLRQKIISDQAGLRSHIEGEEQATRMDEQKAAERRYDYGPLIRTWLSMLAKNGVLKDLVEQHG